MTTVYHNVVGWNKRQKMLNEPYCEQGRSQSHIFYEECRFALESKEMKNSF
jgi:hypothetical protein